MNGSSHSGDRTLEQVHRALRGALDRIETDVEEILDGAAGEDPDDFFERFDADRHALDDVLHELMATARRLQSIEPLELNRLASRALESALVGIEKPLVLSVGWCEGPTRIPAPAEPLKSMLDRIVELVLRVAAAGDEVTFGTRRDGDRVTFYANVECHDPQRSAAAAEQLSMRGGTLHAFALDLGAVFTLGQGGVAIQVAFPTRVASR